MVGDAHPTLSVTGSFQYVTPLIIIAIYLALLLLLGLGSNRLLRKTAGDYFLASRSIGPFLLLMSIFGTTMTAFALVGSTGESYVGGIGVFGMMASWSGIVHSLVFFLVGIKLWSFGKKHGYVTQIQYFRDRFDSDRLGLLLFPILVGLVIPYLLLGVMASGSVISNVTEGAFPKAFPDYDGGLPPWLGALVVCLVVLIYVFFGGMRGTAWANAFQTIVFMVLGVVTFVVIASRLPDSVSNEAGNAVIAASKAVLERAPSKFKRRVDLADKARYEAKLETWEALAEYNYAVKRGELSLTPEQAQAAQDAFKPRMPGWQELAKAGYARQQGLIRLSDHQEHEAYLVQDDRVVPDDLKSIPDWTGIPLWRFPRDDEADRAGLKIFSKQIESGQWTRKQARGVYRATHWRPDEPYAVGKWEFFTYLFIPLSVGMFPHLFQHWLTARSAKSFRLAVIAHPIFIAIVWAPCVLIGAWAAAATLDGRPLIPDHFNPNGVLAFMVNKLVGPGLTGLLSAGILAAIMSSLDSQFLCVGSIFTNDIVAHYIRHDRLSDRQKVVIGRVFVILIVAVTYFLSLREVRQVFVLGVWCFSGFAGLFPVVFFSIYWRRMTKMGAYAGILATAATWLWLFRDSAYGRNPNYLLEIGGVGVMPVTAMVAATALAVVLVSLVTAPPREQTLAKFFQPASR
jgi:SSS family solute:Na+ symporter